MPRMMQQMWSFLNEFNKNMLLSASNRGHSYPQRYFKTLAGVKPLTSWSVVAQILYMAKIIIAAITVQVRPHWSAAAALCHLNNIPI